MANKFIILCGHIKKKLTLQKLDLCTYINKTEGTNYYKLIKIMMDMGLNVVKKGNNL